MRRNLSRSRFFRKTCEYNGMVDSSDELKWVVVRSKSNRPRRPEIGNSCTFRYPIGGSWGCWSASRISGAHHHIHPSRNSDRQLGLQQPTQDYRGNQPTAIISFSNILPTAISVGMCPTYFDPPYKNCVCVFLRPIYYGDRIVLRGYLTRFSRVYWVSLVFVYTAARCVCVFSSSKVHLVKV